MVTTNSPSCGRKLMNCFIVAANGSSTRGKLRLFTRPALLVTEVAPEVKACCMNENRKTPQNRYSMKCSGRFSEPMMKPKTIP